MKNSGLADSPLFLIDSPEPESVRQPPVSASDLGEKDSVDTTATLVTPGDDDTNHDVSHDTVIPLHHDSMVESVRLAVKEFGKEAATHRFTKTEKEAIAAIVYTTRQQGIRTTEVEITRIAVNFIIRDYNARGKQSLLAKTLHALNA